MMKRETLFQVFFLAAFVALIYEFFRLIQPFLLPMFLALVLYLVTLPMDRYLERQLSRFPSGWRALISTLAVVAVLVVPLVLLISLFVGEFKGLLPKIQDTVVSAKAWALDPSWDQWPSVQRVVSLYERYPDLPRIDLNEKIADIANTGVTMATQAGGSLAANTATLLFYVLMIVFTLFFLFKDGRAWHTTLLGLIPMHTDLKVRIEKTVRTTVADIVRGSILTSLIQTMIAITGYWIIGLPAAITLGLATGAASFIPGIGSALVWVPVAIYLFVAGATWKFLFLLVWGTVAISMSDNVLRTFFIGQSVETPIFLMFLALLGGVMLYGAVGLLFGPIIVAVLPVFIQIYKETVVRRE